MVGGVLFSDVVFEKDSDTVVVDSFVYELSKEEMLVSEGPGLDNHVDA